MIKILVVGLFSWLRRIYFLKLGVSFLLMLDKKVSILFIIEDFFKYS